jgi:hypothetical protein
MWLQLRKVIFVYFGQCSLKSSNPVPGGSHPVSRGYKYGDLALQVGGVSDETVRYGHGSWATLTSEWFNCKLQTRPLVREGALHEEIVKQRKLKSGDGLQRGPYTKTNWPIDRRSQYNLNLKLNLSLQSAKIPLINEAVNIFWHLNFYELTVWFCYSSTLQI